MTDAEVILWQRLRNRQLDGFKFRRQWSLGPFIVDFYCPNRHLAIEVDGEAHNLGDRPAEDKRRDNFLRANGLRVVRFSAGDVLHNLEAVVRTILAEASNQLPLPHPSGGPPPHLAMGRNQFSQSSVSTVTQPNT